MFQQARVVPMNIFLSILMRKSMLSVTVMMTIIEYLPFIQVWCSLLFVGLTQFLMVIWKTSCSSFSQVNVSLCCPRLWHMCQYLYAGGLSLEQPISMATKHHFLKPAVHFSVGIKISHCYILFFLVV